MTDGRSCCKVVTVSLVPTTVFILAVAFFAGFIALPTIYTELSYKEQYAVVIDAGSSHSEVFLYSWKLPFYNRTGLVYQNSYCRDPTKNGISSYTDDPSAAGESLEGCLTGVLRKVPKSVNDPSDKKHKVRLWLGATAGMRLLKRENETLSNDILESVRHSLKTSTKADVRILSGREEAVSGWITTNYVAGNFEQKYPMKRDLNSNTVGALDMGGASMQIAYQNSFSSNNFTDSYTLFDTTHDVYARSFLCFGINEAYRRIMAYSVMESRFSPNVSNPCIHEGNSIRLNVSYLFGDHYCTSLLNTQDVSDDTYFNITGASNHTACNLLVQRAMNFSIDIATQEPQEFEVPRNHSGSFLGFSNFYHTTHFFDYSNLNSSNMNNFTKSIDDYCGYSWDYINQHYSSIYRQYYCIDGMFLSHALRNGLGFYSNDTNWSIEFKQQVNDLNIGWSLGYMLQQSKSFYSSPYATQFPYSTVDLVVGMVVLTLLCLVFVIFFAFTFAACRKSLSPTKGGGYTSIS